MASLEGSASLKRPKIALARSPKDASDSSVYRYLHCTMNGGSRCRALTVHCLACLACSNIDSQLSVVRAASQGALHQDDSTDKLVPCCSCATILCNGNSEKSCMMSRQTWCICSRHLTAERHNAGSKTPFETSWSSHTKKQ